MARHRLLVVVIVGSLTAACYALCEEGEGRSGRFYDSGTSRTCPTGRIARACVIGPGTVSRYMERAERRGLGWPVAAGACTAPARRPSSTSPGSGPPWSTDARASGGASICSSPSSAPKLTYAEATETQQLPDWLAAHW